MYTFVFKIVVEEGEGEGEGVKILLGAIFSYWFLIVVGI
jgi:hypothetical protein